MVTSKFIIYALLDPETYDVRYIGKSSSMFKRPSQKHSAHCACWIKSLENRHLKPVVRVLSFEDDKDECNESEKRWIKFFRESGEDLTNIMDGGEGVTFGYKQPKEVIEKRAASLRGKKRAPEIGEKISKALSNKHNVTLQCKNCNHEFIVIRSRIWRKFCSKKCVDDFKRGKRKIDWSK